MPCSKAVVAPWKKKRLNRLLIIWIGITRVFVHAVAEADVAAAAVEDDAAAAPPSFIASCREENEHRW